MDHVFRIGMSRATMGELFTKAEAAMTTSISFA